MRKSIPGRCHGRAKFVSAVVVLAFVVAFVFAGATAVFAISRDEALARGQKWVDSPVPYSQSRYHAGYRTDCSGFVSMCWQTGTSWATSSFHAVTHRIPTSQLAPGDALLKKGYHIRLFYGWTDATHTQYVAYEAGSLVAVCRIHSIADDLAFGYVPVRYNRITSSPKPANVLQNGAFNVWAKSWTGAEQPVWWQTSGPWGQTLVAHRTDTYHSARHALTLLNPSADSATLTELSQTTPVVGGADYRLSAWAETASDPHVVQLSVVYLDAAGESMAETTTSGDSAGLNSSAFRCMSVLLATPPGAATARVSVRLAGGAATDASGGVVPGTSVTLDDISLARPQVSVGIGASSATARNGRTVALSGAVSPASATGAPATLYVQRPGQGWKPLSTSAVYASGGSAVWKGTIRFTKKMRRGIYRFKTTVPAVPGYLGATSGVVSVKLK